MRGDIRRSSAADDAGRRWLPFGHHRVGVRFRAQERGDPMTDAERDRAGGKGPTEDSPLATEDESPEVARLRSERDAARAALNQREQPPKRRGRPRRVVVGVMVVLFAVLLPLTLTFTWVHRTVLDTDTFVNTVQPIASDPAVIAAVSNRVTDQLYA